MVQINRNDFGKSEKQTHHFDEEYVECKSFTLILTEHRVWELKIVL